MSTKLIAICNLILFDSKYASLSLCLKLLFLQDFMQWRPSRISTCVQSKTVQYCSTVKAAEFVEKYYKDYCITLMSWVFQTYMI